MKRFILLGSGAPARNVHAILSRLSPGSEIFPASTAEELRNVPLTEDTWLISHSTSVIVPASLLEKLSCRAINIHSASPAYPGRDPHHFAIYDGATRYGATAHFMTPKVDDGSILDVEWVDVSPDETPNSLLLKANAAALIVTERVVSRLLAGTAAPNGDRWSGRKTTRSAFRELCEVTVHTPAAEVERRRRAVAVPGRGNLFVTLNGIRFYHIEPTN